MNGIIHLLPFGTPAEVKAEAKHYINTLGKNKGYIPYPSQTWDSVVPIANIEALYSARD